MNIQEDFVSFETAKLLKEKGFDEITFTWYNGKGKFCVGKNNYDDYYMNHFPIMEKNKNKCSAPTLQMAMKWLRKNHQIFIRPNTSFLYPIKWYSEIFCYGDNLKTQQDIKTEYYDSPEEACEAAIKYCLEHLI